MLKLLYHVIGLKTLSLGHTNLYPKSKVSNFTTHLTLAYIIIGDATVASPWLSKYAF